jgi:hypothetical protein
MAPLETAFESVYADLSRKSRVPAGAFAVQDQSNLRQQVLAAGALLSFCAADALGPTVISRGCRGIGYGWFHGVWRSTAPNGSSFNRSLRHRYPAAFRSASNSAAAFLGSGRPPMIAGTAWWLPVQQKIQSPGQICDRPLADSHGRICR